MNKTWPSFIHPTQWRFFRILQILQTHGSAPNHRLLFSPLFWLTFPFAKPFFSRTHLVDLLQTTHCSSFYSVSLQPHLDYGRSDELSPLLAMRVELTYRIQCFKLPLLRFFSVFVPFFCWIRLLLETCDFALELGKSNADPCVWICSYQLALSPQRSSMWFVWNSIEICVTVGEFYLVSFWRGSDSLYVDWLIFK